MRPDQFPEINKQEKNTINKIGSQYLKVPLSNEELNMPTAELARKYGVTYGGAIFLNERGYRSTPWHFSPSRFFFRLLWSLILSLANDRVDFYIYFVYTMYIWHKQS